MLCELLVETGFWPSEIPFTVAALNTVAEVFEERNKDN
jgi:hypothetical protein